SREATRPGVLIAADHSTRRHRPGSIRKARQAAIKQGTVPRTMRVVARRGPDSSVCGVVTLAAGQSIRLKSNVLDSPRTARRDLRTYGDTGRKSRTFPRCSSP